MFLSIYLLVKPSAEGTSRSGQGHTKAFAATGEAQAQPPPNQKHRVHPAPEGDINPNANGVSEHGSTRHRGGISHHRTRKKEETRRDLTPACGRFAPRFSRSHLLQRRRESRTGPTRPRSRGPRTPLRLPGLSDTRCPPSPEPAPPDTLQPVRRYRQRPPPRQTRPLPPAAGAAPRARRAPGPGPPLTAPRWAAPAAGTRRRSAGSAR